MKLNWIIHVGLCEIRASVWTICFLFSETTRLAVGPIQAPIPGLPRCFSGVKEAGAWGWLFTSIWCLGCEWVELYFYSLHAFMTWTWKYYYYYYYYYYYCMNSPLFSVTCQTSPSARLVSVANHLRKDVDILRKPIASFKQTLAFCNVYKIWGFCASTSFTVLSFIAEVCIFFFYFVFRFCVFVFCLVTDTSAVEPRP